MKPPKVVWIHKDAWFLDSFRNAEAQHVPGALKYILAPTRARRKKQRKGKSTRRTK